MDVFENMNLTSGAIADAFQIHLRRQKVLSSLLRQDREFIDFLAAGPGA